MNIGVVLNVEDFRKQIEQLLNDYVIQRQQLRNIVTRIDACLSLYESKKKEQDDEETDLQFTEEAMKTLHDIRTFTYATLHKTVNDWKHLDSEVEGKK
jgi:hypothetical protein